MKYENIEWIWFHEKNGNVFGIGQDWLKNWYYHPGNADDAYQPTMETDNRIEHIQYENFKMIYDRIYDFDNRIEQQDEPKLEHWYYLIKDEIDSKMKSNPNYDEIKNKRIIDVLTNNYGECDIVLEDGIKLHLSKNDDFEIIKE